MKDLLAYLVIAVLPLSGGLMMYAVRDKRGIVSTIFVLISFFMAVSYLFVERMEITFYVEWLPGFLMGMRIDRIASILIVLVLFISLLVHTFSMVYMENDPGKNKYFAKLGFFTFSMVGLLMADHLILLFIFWELVGLASYLLIGFWYKKEEVPDSARLAFMVNQIADVALLSGLLILFGSGESLFISESHSKWHFLPSLFIVIGAFGKSAQLPFSGWLPKAMVGPTPVSALIHAATMVVAGVYLLFRVGASLPDDVLTIVTLVGVVTALYGALSALTQNDIKKVLAYSTISQLGYMVAGIGVGAFEATMFHLWTHAFFKAGLFLGAGSVIHYLHHVAKEQSTKFDVQDIRLMGGLRKQLPWTFYCFLTCGLALAGIPFFFGFQSKEGIITALWMWANQSDMNWFYLVPSLALFTALLTAFYIGRLMILTFLGEFRAKELLTNVTYEENPFIKLPLILLAIGSLGVVYNMSVFGHSSLIPHLVATSDIEPDSFISSFSAYISVILSFLGIVWAYVIFKPNSNYAKNYLLSGEPGSLLFRLSSGGFFLAHSYTTVIGRNAERASSVFAWMDKNVLDRILHFLAIAGVVVGKVLAIVDRYIVDGSVNFSARLSKWLGRRFQSVHARKIQMQIYLLLGIILILSWILFFSTPCQICCHLFF